MKPNTETATARIFVQADFNHRTDIKTFLKKNIYERNYPG